MNPIKHKQLFLLNKSIIKRNSSYLTNFGNSSSKVLYSIIGINCTIFAAWKYAGENMNSCLF